jgi:hypothetical protein
MRLAVLIVAAAVVIGLFAWLGWYLVQDVTSFNDTRPCTAVEGGCDGAYKRIKTSYDEGKDLSKAFLTLLVAVFVASITFSEKIIDLKSAGTWERTAMIMCWLSLLLAIAACGTGLVYLASVLAFSLYNSLLAWHQMERAVILIGCSGLLFGVGLVMMLVAGMPAFLKQTQNN